MRKLLAIAMVMGLMASMSSCKKYDDGPLLSLRSKKARVINTWVIDKVTNKGVDVTSQYPEDYTLDIKEDGTFSLLYNGVTFTGKWEFSEDKADLVMTWDVSGQVEKYVIKRLKNKEFDYEQTIGTEVIQYYMAQKE